MLCRIVWICLLCAGVSRAPALSVLQYNCKGNGVTDWSTNSAQVQAIGRQVMYLQPDVITFNEIPQPYSYQMTNFVKAYLPGYFVATSANGDGYITTSIASRYPITRSSSWLHQTSLTPYGASGSKYTRDLFEVEIKVPGFVQPVHVFNSHLKALTDSTSLLRRAAEAGAVSNFFFTGYLTTNATHPYVLTGDLNEDISRPPSGSLQPIQRLVNAATGLQLTTPVNPYNSDDRTISIQTSLTARFDYILPCGSLFSNTASSQVFRTDLLPSPPPPLLGDDDQTASDHLPVMMIFNASVNPPLITSAPQSQTVQLSSNATFTVSVSGAAPLGYQWRFGGNAIAGATSTNLTLTNVLFAEAGSYSVVVTNAGGSATGGPVALTVVDTIPPAISACASDRILAAGTNCQAVLPDLSGQVIAADASGAVTVTQNPPPGTALGVGMTSVTFTARDSSSNAALCTATVTVADLAPPMVLACATTVTLGSTLDCQAALPDLTSTNYMLARDSCSSVIVTQMPPAGTVVAMGTTNPVTLTAYDNAGNATNRVLAIEVSGLPNITAQPTNLSVVVGGNASFTAAACGPGQLSYQWQHAGTNLAAATDPGFGLIGVSANDAGDYAVVVGNSFGSTTSLVATLTVLQPPVITTFGFDSAGFTLTFPTETGPGYRVEYKYSLDDPSWQVLTNVAGTGLPITITDYEPSLAMKLYRVEVR
jgi:endonuclease/exonuclease/phosphatase family metal-dependent hydrolase